jgi:RHS repeat-associated protein
MRYTSLQYFYHPDHLGSASWITDAAGEGYQHFQYLPFGESWVEQRLGTYNSPYQFSGKEKDEETGYNYFGARYYDSELSVWLSVDPMSSNHPNLTAYDYTANSPINFIDIDGNDFFVPPTVFISNGVLSGTKVKNDISSITERPKMNSIQAIVLHRTAGSTATSAIAHTKALKGETGFHIVIDKNGGITQVNNTNNRANHVGKPKGSVSNYNSIGIEVVGLHTGAPGEDSWESLSNEQIESTAQVVAVLMDNYNLTWGDVFAHEDVSRKTPGEGSNVQNAIQSRVQELVNYREMMRVKIPQISPLASERDPTGGLGPGMTKDRDLNQSEDL